MRKFNRLQLMITAVAVMLLVASCGHTNTTTDTCDSIALNEVNNDAPIAINRSMQMAVDSFACNKLFAQGKVSVAVLDIESGKIVAEHQLDEQLITASTMKVVTSACALHLLGADYQFHTKVNTSGKVTDGVLDGNVVVHGSGDPTLSSKFMLTGNIVSDVVAALRAKGVTQITGDVKVDESLIPSDFVSHDWIATDVATKNGRGVHAINYLDNLVQVTYTCRGGELQDVRVNPLIKLEVVNQLNADTTIVDEEYELKYGANPKFLVKGFVGRRSFKRDVATTNPNPGELLRTTMKNAIAAAGITVNGSSKVSQKADSVLVDFTSTRLSEIVKSLLYRSDNLYAECLLRAVAVKGGEPATFEGGVKAARKCLNEMGIGCSQLSMRDGSGLSMTDKASARFFVQMLAAAVADSVKMGAQLPLLLAHHDRYSGLMGESSLAGKIASKSGTMTGVKCFVGCYPIDKPRYYWAVLINDYAGGKPVLHQLPNEVSKLLIELFYNK